VCVSARPWRPPQRGKRAFLHAPAATGIRNSRPRLRNSAQELAIHGRNSPSHGQKTSQFESGTRDSRPKLVNSQPKLRNSIRELAIHGQNSSVHGRTLNSSQNPQPKTATRQFTGKTPQFSSELATHGQNSSIHGRNSAIQAQNSQFTIKTFQFTTKTAEVSPRTRNSRPKLGLGWRTTEALPRSSAPMNRRIPAPAAPAAVARDLEARSHVAQSDIATCQGRAGF